MSHDHGDSHSHAEPLGARRPGAALPSGRVFWKSLEELTGTAEFRVWLDREFPEQASEWDDPEGRRRFMKLMGASLALAGLTACTRQPTEKIVPYVKAPEEMIPGKPLYYATAVRSGGYAKGVLVETHMGRPTKVEGNPEHPASLGATDIFAQAEMLALYDPDRSQTVKQQGEVRPWSAFVAAMRAAVAEQKASRGAGIRILTETITSPTLAAEMQALLAELPEARWHVHEPLGREQARAGAALAFGEPVDPQYRLDEADVIVSLDADFMGGGASNLPLIRAFSARRRRTAAPDMNRLYVVESTPTITGASADHRLPLKASEIEGFARSLAAALDLPTAGDHATGRRAAWIAALAKDLRAHAGHSLVIAGEAQPPAVHVLAHAINHLLGNAGRTVVYTKPVDVRPAGDPSLSALVADLKAGKVGLLVVLGGNPVYSAPADLGFTDALEKAALRVHLGLYDDETSARCHWHVPAAHDFETWGDARAEGGLATILQPLIQPLYGGKSALEVLTTLGSRPPRTPHDMVREHWRAHWPAADFEKSWRRALHDGVVTGTAAPEVTVSFRKEALSGPAPRAASGLEIVFRPDPTIQDGRYANNGWLQELPKPLTKLTWDNAALVSPKTAETLQVKTGDVLRLKHEGRAVSAPVYVMPGQPDETVTVHLGYGRTRVGRVGDGAGFSAYALRTSARAWFASGLEVEKTGSTFPLALTQDHWSMEGRGIVREIPVRSYDQGAEAVAEAVHHQGLTEDPKPEDTLYPPFKYEGHAWGMAIDLNACVGCNACVVACQSENNIPVVVAARRPLLHGRPAAPRDDRHALRPRAVHALRERALRGRLPCRRHRPQRRGPERHGLQPLRGDEVLLEQLSLQGAALQLPPLPGLGDAQPQADAQPRRQRAQPWRDGEVHLLRAAHQRCPHHRQDRGRTEDRGRRDPHCLPAGLPGAGHHLRRHQRPPGRGHEAEGRRARLRPSHRPQHQAAHDVPGGGAQREPGHPGGPPCLRRSSLHRPTRTRPRPLSSRAATTSPPSPTRSRASSSRRRRRAGGSSASRSRPRC
jgi:MoCo/4Fe-4S cofactor protein with predicted Tat translocation signal